MIYFIRTKGRVKLPRNRESRSPLGGVAKNKKQNTVKVDLWRTATKSKKGPPLAERDRPEKLDSYNPNLIFYFIKSS